MATARATRHINAPTETVWETLRAFDGIDQYMPMIARCRVEGVGIGAQRFCTLQDGMELIERLESLDDESRTLRYSIAEGANPFTGYLGTVQVNDLPNNRCEVTWSSTFEATGAPEDELIGMLEGAFASAIDGLEQLHRTDS